MAEGNPFPWGAVIGGVSSLFGNLGANRRQREQESRQYNYNRALATHQNNMNQENWQYQFNATNQYNTPIAQMQRLKEGGINPHMAFSKGGGQNTATAPTMAPYSQEATQAQTRKPLLGGIMEKYMQNKSMELQQKFQSEKLKQEQINTELKGAGLKDKVKKEKYKSELDRKKALNDIEVLLGHNPDGPKYKDGTRLNRYSVGVKADLDAKTLQNETQKVQHHLNKVTADNLISNDEMIRLQTMILKGQSAIFDTQEFKKLPALVKASIYVLFKKIGG